jgi:hypothetical protein
VAVVINARPQTAAPTIIPIPGFPADGGGVVVGLLVELVVVLPLVVAASC